MLTKEDNELMEKGFCPTCKMPMRKKNGKLTHTRNKLAMCERVLRSRRQIKDAYVERDGKKFDTLNIDGRHFKPYLNFKK